MNNLGPEIDIARISEAFAVLPLREGSQKRSFRTEGPRKALLRDSSEVKLTDVGVFIFILAGGLSLGVALFVGWQSPLVAPKMVLPSLSSGQTPVDSLDILRFTPPVAPRSATQVVLPQSWGGEKVGAVPKGSVTHFSDIPEGPSYGDAWYVAETGTYWVYTQPKGFNHPIWVDP